MELVAFSAIIGGVFGIFKSLQIEYREWKWRKANPELVARQEAREQAGY